MARGRGCPTWSLGGDGWLGGARRGGGGDLRRHGRVVGPAGGVRLVGLPAGCVARRAVGGAVPAGLLPPVVPPPLGFDQLAGGPSQVGGLPDGWAFGQVLVFWSYASALTTSLVHLLLALLILADIAFLLQRAGIPLDWLLARLLLQVRPRSTSLGLTVVAMLTCRPLVVVALLVT